MILVLLLLLVATATVLAARYRKGRRPLVLAGSVSSLVAVALILAGTFSTGATHTPSTGYIGPAPTTTGAQYQGSTGYIGPTP